jgi:hypothetical protein
LENEASCSQIREKRNAKNFGKEMEIILTMILSPHGFLFSAKTTKS